MLNAGFSKICFQIQLVRSTLLLFQYGPTAEALDDGASKNMSGTQCVMKNDWYSACEECVNTWEQCGGLDYTGGGCCRDVNDACDKVDDFFWQCRPADTPL